MFYDLNKYIGAHWLCFTWNLPLKWDHSRKKFRENERTENILLKNIFLDSGRKRNEEGGEEPEE